MQLITNRNNPLKSIPPNSIPARPTSPPPPSSPQTHATEAANKIEEHNAVKSEEGSSPKAGEEAADEAQQDFGDVGEDTDGWGGGYR
jgi:hypothetical protein